MCRVGRFGAWRFGPVGCPNDAPAWSAQAMHPFGAQKAHPQPDKHPVGRVALFFQERIKGPKNGSIARFSGLGCYQTRSERRARKRCGKTPAKRLALKLAVFWARRRGGQISHRIRAVKAGQRPNRRLAVGAKARAGEGRGRRVRLLPLFFQERTKGPENAPIARFSGLGCYQTRSEERAQKDTGKAPADLPRSLRSFGRRAKVSQCIRAVKTGLAAGGFAEPVQRLAVDAKAQKALAEAGQAYPLAFALFSGANKRPQKRPHRTVFRAWLLSNR